MFGYSPFRSRMYLNKGHAVKAKAGRKKRKTGSASRDSILFCEEGEFLIGRVGIGQLLSASMTNINSYTWSADYDYNKDGNIDSKTVNSDTTDFAYDGDLMTKIGDDTLDWNYNGQLTESVIASLEYNWDGKLRSVRESASFRNFDWSITSAPTPWPTRFCST
jgi:hypothetical protein